MAVEEDRRRAFRAAPVRGHDGVPRRLVDLGGREADLLERVPAVVGAAPDVGGALRVGRHAGDREEFRQLVDVAALPLLDLPDDLVHHEGGKLDGNPAAGNPATVT